jgi:hypothetical protein
MFESKLSLDCMILEMRRFIFVFKLTLNISNNPFNKSKLNRAKEGIWHVHYINLLPYLFQENNHQRPLNNRCILVFLQKEQVSKLDHNILSLQHEAYHCI